MDAWWHEVWVTLQAEFADITDAQQMTRVTVRLLMAALLGGILGFEREHKGKAAGVRTHMLVALGGGAVRIGATDVRVTGRRDESGDTRRGRRHRFSRRRHHPEKNTDGDEGHVKGLTTAAGLWMTAAIGVAAGLGREATAVLSTVLALAIFSVMPVIVRALEKGGKP
nr:MgtC/SapB family protein [Pseudomonas brassicacearum subsp. brassicacearum]